MTLLHKPTKYGVIGNGGVTHGFRCAWCGIPSRRFATRELRDQRLTEHLAEAKK